MCKVCWWSFSCLSPLAFSIHHCLEKLLAKRSTCTVHQSLPACIELLHIKSYAKLSHGGRCYWVPWGPDSESTFCMTHWWVRQEKFSNSCERRWVCTRHACPTDGWGGEGGGGGEMKKTFNGRGSRWGGTNHPLSSQHVPFGQEFWFR